MPGGRRTSTPPADARQGGSRTILTESPNESNVFLTYHALLLLRSRAGSRVLRAEVGRRRMRSDAHRILTEYLNAHKAYPVSGSWLPSPRSPPGGRRQGRGRRLARRATSSAPPASAIPGLAELDPSVG